MNKSFRNLNNYKEQQKKVAERKGVLEALRKAKTLTEARAIVYGKKDKVISGWRGHSDWIPSMRNKQHKRLF